MRNLLKADLQRITAKRSIWIVIALSAVVLAIMLAAYMEIGFDEGLSFVRGGHEALSDINLIFGFVLLLGVFSDEFKYMVMIRTIGGGVSRKKYVIAKFLDTLILTLQVHVIFAVVTAIVGAVYGVSLTKGEMLFLVLSFLFSIAMTVSSITISSIFFYLTGSAVFGAIAYLTVTFVLPVVLEIMKIIPESAKYHLERWSVDGFINKAVTLYLMGAVGEGVMVTAAMLVIFVGAAGAISYAVFRKKELDF